ncbi:MAG: hypothetical protein JWR80_3624 [Bradyrhizobium sp.]|jgi:hypothetical protein|nr:hypothetical protein [Bradyrhizobium sp.]
MRKFHSIAALCGDGLRPELQALFDRLAIAPIPKPSSGLMVCSSPARTRNLKPSPSLCRLLEKSGLVWICERPKYQRKRPSAGG